MKNLILVMTLGIMSMTLVFVAAYVTDTQVNHYRSILK